MHLKRVLRIRGMFEHETILAQLFSLAREKEPGLTQEKFAQQLSAIGLAKGYIGFSTGSISKKLRDSTLHQRRKFPQYKIVMRGFAERYDINLDDILRDVPATRSSGQGVKNA